MSVNTIEWNEETVHEHLGKLEESRAEITSIPKIPYELSSGMAVMQRFGELQEKVQNVLDLYMEKLGSDIMQIDGILRQMLGVDEQVAVDLGRE